MNRLTSKKLCIKLSLKTNVKEDVIYDTYIGQNDFVWPTSANKENESEQYYANYKV